jgi:Uma2 family endonuclease
MSQLRLPPEVPAVERRRMSYDEWLALPEKPKSEWVDGEVVIVNVPPSPDHSDASFGMHTEFKRAFPSYKVYADVWLRLPRNRVRRPDLMVVTRRATGSMVTDVPILVVEVLSPGTHAVDILEKPREYAEAGVGQFWIIDPETRSVEVYELVDGGWSPVTRIDDFAPVGDVEVPGHGTVHVDIDAFLENGPTTA